MSTPFLNRTVIVPPEKNQVFHTEGENRRWLLMTGVDMQVSRQPVTCAAKAKEEMGTKH